MKPAIIASAVLLALATPSWSQDAVHDGHAHDPAPRASVRETPPSAERQDPAPTRRPDMTELMTEAGETLHADHGEDHANCCKIKKPAQ